MLMIIINTFLVIYYDYYFLTKLSTNKKKVKQFVIISIYHLQYNYLRMGFQFINLRFKVSICYLC